LLNTATLYKWKVTTKKTLRTITRKSEVKELLEKCFVKHHTDGWIGVVEELNRLILSQKVKFPLLEYCGEQLYLQFPKKEHLLLCDKIQSLKTEGGNVVLGIILQKRLREHFTESLAKATEYVSEADIWYVCDIIGERVYGYSLLQNPEMTIPEIKKLFNHPTNWVIRSLGAGIHYAIKKGLEMENVVIVFKLLLSMANTKDKEIRQGVGWAAKTTAKFHPEIIDLFKDKIENTDQVANWFRTKTSIGLSKHYHAKRN